MEVFSFRLRVAKEMEATCKNRTKSREEKKKKKKQKYQLGCVAENGRNDKSNVERTNVWKRTEEKQKQQHWFFALLIKKPNVLIVCTRGSEKTAMTNEAPAIMEIQTNK
jgi:hypothetical protein